MTVVRCQTQWVKWEENGGFPCGRYVHLLQFHAIVGEYTVRWPGHIQKYQKTDLSPDELVDSWKFDSQRPEFTWMEVCIKSGDTQETWTVEDSGKDGDSSMARTTGLVTYSCALAWSKNELFKSGVFAPEDLPNEVIESIIETMKSEGVSIDCQISVA